MNPNSYEAVLADHKRKVQIIQFAIVFGLLLLCGLILHETTTIAKETHSCAEIRGIKVCP